MARDITFSETVTVRGYELQVSGMIYPGERGSDRVNAPGTDDVPDEIEIEEILYEEVSIGFELLNPLVISEVKAALIKRWASEGEY